MHSEGLTTESNVQQSSVEYLNKRMHAQYAHLESKQGMHDELVLGIAREILQLALKVRFRGL